ncbi:MAG TPA: Spy/CpxP family protein refolding chaperone [Myxococcota bacterium]|nr:Spy/CpxP family protein refolding chaperone [Myxococcota bacterium]
MKKYLLTGSLVALVALFSAVDANARGRGHHGCMGQGRAGQGFAGVAGLNLSAEQQKKIAELKTEMVKSTAAARTELDAKRAELQSLWSAERPDRGAILAKQAEMDLLRQKLRTSRVDHRLAVMELLTAEQRAKFATFRGKGFGGDCKGGCMGPCGGKGHGHGPGSKPGMGFGGGR